MIYDDVDWMTVDDHDATTGNGYVTHVCQGGYKGRVQRRGHTTITTEDASPKTMEVDFVQLPLDEYVTFDQLSYAATKDGGNITITGKTNSPRLGFVLTDDADGICTLPQYFSIQPEGDLSPTTNQYVSGQVFDGDPGATKEIAFTIVVTISSNTDTNSRACRIVAIGSNDVTAETYVNQEEGESYIYVDTDGTTSKTISFAAANAQPVSVDVLSNDTWIVEHDDSEAWSTVDDETIHHLDGELTFSVSDNPGRQTREKQYSLVANSGETATVDVDQAGTTYLGGLNTGSATYNILYIEYRFFISNAQKFEIELAGTDASHFTISKVYLKYGGQNHNIEDWSGVIEPEGDPGLTTRYEVYVRISMPENDTAYDKVATLTCTAYNDGSEEEYTWSSIIQHNHA